MFQPVQAARRRVRPDRPGNRTAFLESSLALVGVAGHRTARQTTAAFCLSVAGCLAVGGAVLNAGCSDSGGSPAGPAITGAVAQQTNLVANRSAVGGAGAQIDAQLVNPWGVSFGSNGPLWVSDNHSGVSTIYDGAGVKQGLVVSIAGPGGTGVGAPTGQVFNGTQDFVLPNSKPAVFLFATEDGTLYGWNGGTAAVQVADRSAAGAVYKGLAMASTGTADFLYAADFHNAHVDVFDRSFTLQPAASFPFNDPGIPAGFAPFGIQNINGQVYVTYAMQALPDRMDDEKGPGNGFVDVYSPSGILLRRLVSRGPLNSPWGLTTVPSGAGALNGALLVGNFGDGHVNVFDPNSGAFLGPLKNSTGGPLVIDGLWALVNGNVKNGDPNAVYFTAGPNGESDGLIGKLQILSAASRRRG